MSQPPPLPPTVRAIPRDLPAYLRKPRRGWSYLLVGAAITLGLVGLGLLAAGAAALVIWWRTNLPDAPGYAAADPAVRHTPASINSAGATVAIEVFEPAAPGKYPVVLVLPGFEGLATEPWRRYYHGQCQELARNGHAAVLLHYLDRTGSRTIDLKSATSNFQPWALTVLDGLSYAAALPASNGQSIGVVGTDLGGALGAAVAATDARVGAVVQFSGVVPDQMEGKLARMPPMLLLHGGHNRYIPLERAERSKKLLTTEGRSCQLHVYPEEGHALRGAAAPDALARAVAFLKQHTR